jgi:lipopolysaccharide transport system ATP-binding protein
MYVRLAFAVAAHLEPEILLVDEVLAVGDAMFQKKCLGKMDAVAKQGRTVLLVSHNMAAIQNLCTRAVVLENGRLVKADSADNCVRFYLDQFNKEEDADLSHRGDRRGTGKIRIMKVFFERDGKIALNVQTGKPCSICFDYQAEEAQKNISVAFTVRDERAQFLFRPSTEDTGYNFNCVPGRGVFRCNIEKLPLVPGRYRITTRVIANHEEADYIEGAAFLFVEKGDFFGTGRLNTHSPVLIEHAWELE